MDHAIKMRMPIIGINDSGWCTYPGRGGFTGRLWRNFSSAIHRLPVLSLNCPLFWVPCAGGAVYSPALTDFVFVVDNISKMFITGPEVVKTVLGEEVKWKTSEGARSCLYPVEMPTSLPLQKQNVSNK